MTRRTDLDDLIDALHLQVAAEHEASGLTALPRQLLVDAMAAMDALAAEARADPMTSATAIEYRDAIRAHLDQIASFREQKIFRYRDRQIPKQATAAEAVYHDAIVQATGALRAAWGVGS